ncbi:MAG TPA: DUF202 domain-containing protein [Candidatus Binatia bacterium]|nr:DUF202 domain-containing protein [Candidatus Binatia bacterium]
MDISTWLATERTRLAYERTTMSWVRTGTSLITFGFTIYKFFQLENPAPGPPGRLIGPREFALLLVLIGLGSLVLGTWEERQGRRALRRRGPDVPRSMASVVAAWVAMLGILALVVMILRR